jgi:hypothetical protein
MTIEAPDAALDAIADAIHAAARGQALVESIHAIGKALRDRQARVRDDLIEIEEGTSSVMAKIDLARREAAVLAALDGLGTGAGHQDVIAKARPLADALRAAPTIAAATPSLILLEAVLRKAGVPVVHQHDQHYWDGQDAAFADKAERTSRFRSFVGRFLAVTSTHDFVEDPDQRRLHSGLQASIWRCRHANADEFDARLADCERKLKALCALAGVPEPVDADLSPETLVDGFNPEPDQIDTIEDRDDAIRRERVIVLERFRDLVNRVTPAVDQADYADPEQRQIAADLRAAMTTASHTSNIARMTAAMGEAEKLLAALTGQDVPEEGGEDDGPDY